MADTAKDQKDAAAGSGVKDEVEAAHKARTEGDTASVAKGEVMDARLDNRTGRNRPRATEGLLPQQVDGPDILHHDEFVKKSLAAQEKSGVKDARGALATGPYGEGHDPYEEHSRDGSAEGEPEKAGDVVPRRR